MCGFAPQEIPYITVLLIITQAGLKIIQLYREGYRQDWELSFEKNTRTKGGWYACIFVLTVRALVFVFQVGYQRFCSRLSTSLY
jgi:hypothetical protein